MDFPAITVHSSNTFEFRHTFGSDSSGLRDSAIYDFITVLAVAQKLEIEFLSLTWQSALERVGSGKTSQISQSSINWQTSLAFKRVADRDKLFEPHDHIFRSVINEMIALRHSSIRNHPNIVELQGFCWDIPLGEDLGDDGAAINVWPVLVFEKSPYGDLGSFATVPLGRALDFDQRLGLCVDIGRAINDMHSNNFIHGDIKPQNVLIFRNQATGTFTAKVIDFGFSSRYSHENDHLKLAYTPPWDAPELRKYTEFKPGQARKTDVFSYGMLCLWTLFEQRLSSDDTHLSQYDAQLHVKDAVSRLAAFKAADKLMLVSHQMLEQQSLEPDRKERLRQFFESSFSHESIRTDGLQQLLALLAPERNDDDQCEVTQFVEILSPSTCEFKITYDLRPLYAVDFRVRSYITSCLEKHLEDAAVSCNRADHENTAFQLSICYSVGFGIDSSDEKSRAMLKLSGKGDSDLSQELELFSNPKSKAVSGTIFSDLYELGHISMFDTAGYYREHGLLQAAEKMVRQDIAKLREVVGEKSICLFDLLHMLCVIVSHQGRFVEAEGLMKEMMEKSQRLLGKEHVATLNCMEILASAYRILGQHKEGETLSLQLVQSRERRLGPEHPSTLNAMDLLASIYRDEGRLQDAEELGLRVMLASTKILGEEHFATLSSMENLASTYRGQGRWKDAIRVGEKVLSISTKIYGDKSPIVLVSMGNLVKAYYNDGRLLDAEEKAFQAKETSLSVLGIDHPATLFIMTGLATAYQAMGRWDQAEELGKMAVEGQLKHSGEESPFTFRSMSELATTYRFQRQWDKAEQLEARALESSIKVLGPEHPDTLVSMGNQATAYRHLGRQEEAEAMGLRVMETTKMLLGPEHPHTLVSMGNIALLYRDQGRLSEAEMLETQVLAVRDKTLGADHPETIFAADNLALTYLALCRFSEAEMLGVRAKTGSQRVLGTEHPLTLMRMDNLALIYESQERWEDAEEIEVELVETRRKVLGEAHPGTTNAMGNLIMTYRHQNKLREANELETKLMAILDSL